MLVKLRFGLAGPLPPFRSDPRPSIFCLNQTYIGGTNKIEDEVFYNNRPISRALRRWPSISNAYAARTNQNKPVVADTRMTRIVVNGPSNGSFCVYAEMVRGGARRTNLDASKNQKATRLQNGWLRFDEFRFGLEG